MSPEGWAGRFDAVAHDVAKVVLLAPLHHRSIHFGVVYLR
jgi:hypothetical protein